MLPPAELEREVLYAGDGSRVGSAHGGPGSGALRRAWRHFQQYRGAVARAVADED